MKKEELTAESISIENPCSEKWDEMTGNEKTRACSHCELNVNDISMMTEDEAFELIEKSNGDLCVRYEAHPVTHAPIFANKLYQITRTTGVTAGVLGATLAVSNSVNAQESVSKGSPLKPLTPIVVQKNSSSNAKTTSPKVSPTPPKKPRQPKIMGKIAIRRWIKNPLMKAVNQGKYLKARLMIAKGANVNAIDKNYYSRTALHVAVERNNLKMAQMLLNSGAKLELQDQYKNTPLMNLRWSTTTEIIYLFAQYGADLNAKNYSGQTALMNAARSGNAKAVQAMLESGADVTIRDNFKNSALDYTHSPEIKQILISYGAVRKAKS